MNIFNILIILSILTANAQTGTEDFIADLDDTQMGYFISYKDGIKNVEYLDKKNLR